MFVLAAVALSLSSFVAPSTAGLWSGSFHVGQLHGGLQLTLSASEKPSLILQPSGITTIYKVEDLHTSKGRVALNAPAGAGRRLTFDGKVTGDTLAGSVLLQAGGSIAKGKWASVRVEPIAKPGELPPNHGPYAIGRSRFDWIDASREEPRSPGQKRELVVYLWYPAERTANCTPALYLPDAKLMGDALPSEVATFVNSATTGACADAALSLAAKRYPVVIFLPGDEFKTLGYSAIQEDLASRGYIVAAVDIPFNAPVVELSGGRVVRPPADQQRSNDEVIAQLDQWARDAAFVAQRIRALDHDEDRFHNRIETAEIGVLGHSAGGLAAFHACQIDSTLRACANLDGRYRARPYPIASAAEAPKQPFLWIHAPLPLLSDEQLREHGISRTDFDKEMALGGQIMAGIASGSDDVTIDQIGFDHLDFTDFRIFEKGISVDTLASRQRTLEITRTAVSAFFDGALRGKRTSVAGAMPWRRYPDASVIHDRGTK